MIKTGIWSARQLEGGRDFVGAFGGKKRISIALYNKLEGLPERARLEERILLLFSDDRGAFKRTYEERFSKFDDYVCRVVEKNMSPKEKLNVADLAVSDGRTSVCFYRRLKGAFPDLDMLCTDYGNSVRIYRGRVIRVAVSSQGDIVETVFPPFVFNNIKGDHGFYFVNRLVSKIVGPLAKSLVKKRAGRPDEVIELYSAAAKELQSKEAGFSLAERDIRHPFPQAGNYHIIRAMNILNADYFCEDDIRTVISNIFAALKDGGLFVVGSNEEAESEVHGSVYRKMGNRFSVVKEFSGGPPIKDSILGFCL